VYSKPYEFSAVHETGHALCVACFPPLSQKELVKELPHLPSSHPIANLHSLQLADEDILPWPSRITEINIWYDKGINKHDGEVRYNPVGLSNEQRLLITLGGKVAELMARTEGRWDITEIQTRFSNREFDNINVRDMQKAYELLGQINENSNSKRSLPEFVSMDFIFLEDVWNIVDKIAKAVISKYDLEKREGSLEYQELSYEIHTQLHRLESTPYLKNI
jgi:hypothetical protein